MTVDTTTEEEQQLQPLKTDDTTQTVSLFKKINYYKVATVIVSVLIILTLITNFPYQIVLTYKINGYIECAQQDPSCLEIITAPTYECNSYNQTCPPDFECLFICTHGCRDSCPTYIPIDTYEENYTYQNISATQQLGCVTSTIQCAYPINGTWGTPGYSTWYTTQCNGFSADDLAPFGSIWYYYYVTSYIIMLCTSIIYLASLFNNKFAIAITMCVIYVINNIVLVMSSPVAYSSMLQDSNILVCTNIIDYMPILDGSSVVQFFALWVTIGPVMVTPIIMAIFTWAYISCNDKFRS